MVESEPVFTLIPLLFFLFMSVFAIGMVAFWIWMLVDCIQNEPSEGNDKIVWVLVLLFTNWLGAIIYFFARRRERIRQRTLATSDTSRLP